MDDFTTQGSDNHVLMEQAIESEHDTFPDYVHVHEFSTHMESDASEPVAGMNSMHGNGGNTPGSMFGAATLEPHYDPQEVFQVGGQSSSHVEGVAAALDPALGVAHHESREQPVPRQIDDPVWASTGVHPGERERRTSSIGAHYQGDQPARDRASPLFHPESGGDHQAHAPPNLDQSDDVVVMNSYIFAALVS